jgi:MFS family permease
MAELSQRRRLVVLAVCCASIVVVVMDISIVNVALPAMRRDLHASVSGLQWTVDADTLVLASFLVLAGSTADRVGRRRIFQAGLAAFGLGSLLCGLAPGVGWLIAARVLQAGGGTMLNPVAMSIVATTFPGRAERARAIGVFGSVSGLALGLGPILGGALVDGFGRRFIFWVNVPIVAAAIAGAALFVPESRAARARRFDPVGQTLVMLVLGSVVYAIIESGRLGWTSPVILGLLAAAVLGVLGILGYEPRRADPLLELRLFRSVPFSAAIVMALCGLCAFGAFLFVTTLYQRGARRVVDGARAGPGHLGPRAAQHRAPGRGYRRARGGTVPRGGPGHRPASRRCQPSMSAAATLAMCSSGLSNNWAAPCARLKYRWASCSQVIPMAPCIWIISAATRVSACEQCARAAAASTQRCVFGTRLPGLPALRLRR